MQDINLLLNILIVLTFEYYYKQANSSNENLKHHLKYMTLSLVSLQHKSGAGGFMLFEAKATIPNHQKPEIKHQCHRCFCVAVIYKINMFSSKDPQTH